MGLLAENASFESSIPPAADVSVGIIYSIFGVCSLCGNSVLLYVSYRKRHLLKPAELFIVNQALSDLGMTVTLYPLAVPSSFYHRWLFGRTVCVFYAFCGILFGICSLTTLTILSTVCCLKVCYPVYGNRFSHRHSSILAVCAWLYALVFACSPLVRWGSFGPEPYGTACCIDWGRSSREPLARSYTLALFLCCYALPCALISSSYTLILLTMRHSRRALRQHSLSKARARLRAHTRMANIQIVIVKLSVAVCIGFLAAWSPYAVVSMWAAFGHYNDIPPLAFAVPAVFAKSSPIYNPLVYLLLKPNFRQDLHSLLLACVCVRGGDGGSSGGGGPHKSACPDPGAACARILYALHQRAESAAGLGQPVSGMEQCVCEHCHDPFEHFRHYPRGCQLSVVNTAQLCLESTHKHTHTHTHTHRHLPERAHTRTRAGFTRDPQRPVRVTVRGKKSSDVDSLEITLETVQSSS